MRRPNSEFVAGFALSRNLFQGNAAGAEDNALVDIGGVRIRAQTALRGAVHISIRPEDIFISREPIRSTAGDSFQGKITGVVDKGSVIYVTVSVPPDFTCLASRQAFGELNLKTGMDVYLTIRASAVHVF
jgi:ABC-type Fe3+/spermidine/putrescine transport system ATPase subunit